MNSLQIITTVIVLIILLLVSVYCLHHIGKLKTDIRKYEEREYLFFENTHIAALIVDPGSGRIMDANWAASQFYGYKREELQNMSIDKINICDIEYIKEKMQITLKNQCPIKHTFRHKLANGTVRDVEVLSGPINISGKVMLYSIVTDITVRKTEELLQRVRNEVAMYCLDSVSLQELLDRSVEIIHEIDGIIGCSICIFDDGKNLLEIKAGTALSKENYDKLYNKQIISKLTEIAYQGEPVYFENIDQSNEFLKPFIQLGIKSLGVIPVKRNDIIVGTLNVASSCLNEFPEEMKRALQSITYSIGISY